MLLELFIIAYAIAAGYVAAGLVSSFYSLMTNRPASFQVAASTMIGRALQVPVIVFGGPFIVMRNALRSRAIENQSLSWLCLSLLIVVTWSFISGLFVIHIALSL